MVYISLNFINQPLINYMFNIMIIDEKYFLPTTRNISLLT
jgi:hypothetical protein